MIRDREHFLVGPTWAAGVTFTYGAMGGIFGSWYIPSKNEHTPWETGPEAQDQHRSFWQNTIGPFRDSLQMLKTAPGEEDSLGCSREASIGAGIDLILATTIEGNLKINATKKHTVTLIVMAAFTVGVARFNFDV